LVSIFLGSVFSHRFFYPPLGQTRPLLKKMYFKMSRNSRKKSRIHSNILSLWSHTKFRNNFLWSYQTFFCGLCKKDNFVFLHRPHHDNFLWLYQIFCCLCKKDNFIFLHRPQVVFFFVNLVCKYRMFGCTLEDSLNILRIVIWPCLVLDKNLINCKPLIPI
jgi:hypothetical protein